MSDPDPDLDSNHDVDVTPDRSAGAHRLHHVGIACADPAPVTTLYHELFGWSIAHEERLPERGLQVAFLGAETPYLELVAPIGADSDTDEDEDENENEDDADADGPIERFLRRSGPGLHHLAYAVPDVAAAIERARAVGVDPVDERPRPGAWGHQVAFLRPEPAAGVLFELIAIAAEPSTGRE